MNRLWKRLGEWSFEGYTAPVAFFALTLLGFGLLAPRLGYYQDDWPYLFYAFNKGIPSLVEELYWDSRPNAAWLYISLFTILGFRPLAWHFAALIARWMTGTFLWMLFRRIWPARPTGSAFAIMLFLVHPFFLIQPAAVNAMLYWAGFLFFSLSLWLMATSLTAPRARVVLVAAAVLLEALHLFTSEYFVGLVLVRPLLLWWMIRKTLPSGRVAIRKTLRTWLPYLVALATYVLWRLFMFNPPPGGDRNAPRLLFEALNAPFSTSLQLARTALQDSTIVTITSWYKTLGAEYLGFSTIFDWVALGVMVVAFGGVFLYLTRPRREPPPGPTSSEWHSQALLLGLVVVGLGLLPLWLIGQDIVSHKNPYAATRFGIGASLGAALVLAAMVDFLVDQPRKKAAVIATFTALAVGMHLHNAQLFVYSWEKQVRVYQQFLWRAPAIEPGTAIISDQEFLPVMGQYATAFGIMTAYQVGDVNVPPLWYFPLYNAALDLEGVVQGISLEHGRVSMLFRGSSKESLVVSFEPEQDRCLWILQPEDASLRLIPEDLRRLSSVSSVERIHASAADEQALPAAIFGHQTQKGWCYYFEQADLARQFWDWERVRSLWDAAQADSERPGNGFEYLPFIEAYAHLNEWETARLLAVSASKVSTGLEPTLCDALIRIEADTSASSARGQALVSLRDRFVCTKYD